VSRRRVDFAVVGSGAVLWLLAFAMPSFREEPTAQVSLNMSIMAVFLFAAAFEFFRSRNDRLTARWPLISLLMLHAIFSVVGAVDSLVGWIDLGAVAILQSWYGFLHLETLAFVIGTSIFTVAMARERNEMEHKIAANTDALTGVSTRRHFYERGEAMLAETKEHDASLALILFDLDGFKAINDTFGHGPGDEVLRIFGDAAKRTLRSSDLIGRLGGEEFAALLPGASVGAAYVAAERIRVAFATSCGNIDGKEIRATVSAGIAQAHTASTLDSLMQASDLALYRAKMQGRDRVEVAEREEEPRPSAKIALAEKRVA
jgi:diguanylate cyclase (GGDEF)-like protein